VRFLLLLSLMVSVSNVSATEHEIALLSDPAGDDNGNGTLVYPQRSDYKPGDLDLLSLRVVRTENAYRFEATFKNPIRDPATVAGDVGPEPLSYFARRGFYEFNLDIYIDQDRIKGSGNTYTLPGRHVKIDEAYAWEKAIILTPRPELMQEQLTDAVAESEGENNTDKVAKRLGQSIYFPTKIQVRYRTISFLVPDTFLATTHPGTSWAITAFVTGAKTSIEANFDQFSSSSPDTELKQLALGVLQPQAGRPRDTFGYSGVVAPSPVVDLLAPTALMQQELLSGTTALTGVTWAASNTPVSTGSSTPVTSIVPAVPVAPHTPVNTDRKQGSIADRLRQLDELRKEKLINEKEYEELRRKILSEL